MNNARRKEIEKITADLEAIKERIEALQEEEQDAFDNLPESIQYGERGDKMQSTLIVTIGIRTQASTLTNCTSQP